MKDIETDKTKCDILLNIGGQEVKFVFRSAPYTSDVQYF